MTAPHILALLTAIALLGFGVAICSWFLAYRFPVVQPKIGRVIFQLAIAFMVFFVFGVVAEIGERAQTMMVKK